MLETRRIRSKCVECNSNNDIALSYFLNKEYIFSKYVIATCKSCHKNYVVAMEASRIH
jgi:formate dehydrogenase maturation protein FdhE